MTAVVYRCYDANGVLLYIGRTLDASTRMRGHKSRSAWWPDVDHTEFTPCVDYDDAVRLEREQIAALRPRHNDQFADRVDPNTEHIIGAPVSYTTFNNLKCRCAGCRAAKAAYARGTVNRSATTKAKTRAVRWVRENHPDVWADILDDEYDRFGKTRRPKGQS